MLSCTVTKPVKTGEMAFQVKQFKWAIELLVKEFESTRVETDKARKARLLGLSHDMLNNYGEALQWYDVADQYYQSERSSLELAQSLKKNERYRDAAQLYAEMHSKYRNQDYRRESVFCQDAIKQQERINEFKVESFQVNTAAADYSPVLFEENFIIFSSDRDGSTGNKTYKWNGRSFSDLYVSDRNGRQIYGFDAIINTESNEGTVCFTKDFQEIFFTRCVSTETRDQTCKIYYSQRPNGFWLEPEPLMFFDDNTNFGQPCLIEEDSVLIFSAKLPGSDNYDLYASVRLGMGWSEAELMPSSINTTRDEKFPTSYNDTLFFSSNGHMGYGGLDIFSTYLRSDGSWTSAKNAGIPINSGADDFGLIILEDQNGNNNIIAQGMFSSARNTGMNDDIFKYIHYRIEKEEVTEDIAVNEDTSLDKEYLIYLSGRVVENIYENGDPNADIISKEPIDNALVQIRFELDTINEVAENGLFLHKLSTNQTHTLIVKSRDHLSKQVKIQIPNFESIRSDTTISVEIALDRIVYDKEIIISNVYYDFDNWDIRSDAEPALDSLYEVLLINPQLNIQLASHTDCRGEELYNQELSRKRAESVVEYLETKGLDKTRFTAVGYGERRPSVDCVCQDCTEEQHQANRRTTFTILKL